MNEKDFKRRKRELLRNYKEKVAALEKEYQFYKELENCILNLSPEYDFDLFVTIPEKNLNLTPQILSTFPKAQIQVVDNIGYDIFPFIKVIKSVNIDDYSGEMTVNGQSKFSFAKTYIFLSLVKNILIFYQTVATR